MKKRLLVTIAAIAITALAGCGKNNDPVFDAKVRAILCYRSQLGTVWQTAAACERDLRAYAQRRGGERLWLRRDATSPWQTRKPGP